jgi:2-oxoglutarate dehydrogenase E1 component
MAGVDILVSALSGGNAAYLADLYARWAEAPGSVDHSFAELFASLDDEARSVLTDATGASWAPRHWDAGEAATAAPPTARSAASFSEAEVSSTRSACRSRKSTPSSIPQPTASPRPIMTVLFSSMACSA